MEEQNLEQLIKYKEYIDACSYDVGSELKPFWYTSHKRSLFCPTKEEMEMLKVEIFHTEFYRCMGDSNYIQIWRKMFACRDYEEILVAIVWNNEDLGQKKAKPVEVVEASLENEFDLIVYKPVINKPYKGFHDESSQANRQVYLLQDTILQYVEIPQVSFSNPSTGPSLNSPRGVHKFISG
ncbi:hypothetical protein Scep_028194 [Stephania cephalantha]|uniref:Uncharacterized protein n=1 Tax=Stephania cephalantha TaxID=152367 RepID=A0AAP0HLK0_9MAGN